MRALIVGGSGLLGTDLRNELWLRGHEVVSPARADFDITDPISSGRLVAGEFGDLDICVNCAAYTAVDKAESERRAATELNVIGPGYLSNACSALSIRLIHLSTDFVFDGSKLGAYTEEDTVHPLGVYGRTKADGEREVLQSHFGSLVVRTSWLYGLHGNSFPGTMIRAWKAGKKLRVVADQVGCPTYTVDLAKTIVDLAEANPFPGVYQAVGPESMSWHAFAVRAVTAYAAAHGLNMPIDIEAIASEDWPTPAKRPANSVLSTDKIAGLGIAPMRSVDASLAEFVKLVEA